jgi:2-oxoglutarate ferredoxin oxidoreductase subunit alpha
LVCLQAESEIGAVHMVIGASAAGKRTMTSSSSPGIALKAEGLSYLAGCDIPAVVANIQRGGPGLGTIQPAQSDYWLTTRSAGHGDFRMITLAPSTVQEMFDFTYEAFDLADKYRMTVMVLTDGILGQMMEPLVISEDLKPTPPEKDWALTGTGYSKEANKPGRKKRIVNSLYLQAADNERVNFARFARYAEIEKTEARHESFMADDADVVVVAFGAVARVARNAVKMARESGIKAGLIRPITLWPFPKEALLNKAQSAKAFVTAEMNLGQMYDDVELAIRCSRPNFKCLRAGGELHTPENILDSIKEALKEGK